MLITNFARPEFGWRCAVSLSGCSKSDIQLTNIYSSERNTITSTKAFYLISAGQFSLAMGDIENAISYYKNALDLYGTKSDYINRAVSCNWLAQSYIQNREIYKAYGYLEDAMKLVSIRKPDTYLLNQLHFTRAAIHLLSGELDKASKRFVTIFKSFPKQQKKNTYLKAQCAFGLAEIKLHKFDYEQTSFLISIGKEISELNSYLYLILQGHYLQGRLLYEKTNYDLSQEELLIAERIARQSRMEYWITKISILQAALLSKTHQTKKALITIEDCIEVSSSRGYKLLRVDSLIIKAAIYQVTDEKPDNSVLADTVCNAKFDVEETGYSLAEEAIHCLDHLVPT